ncbi:hypothetical protein GWI33_005321 [Rhynchophorus ferrugineus]|uniref:Uncharacterized protein n=1 Tax=Rhynchophorus ferrugineus TaxID=354439 RepID=A0A834IU17_RHYFE|nr:hypothetical protein GWI33_005321 [Rhynchophorus ferrugineus]
MKTTRWIIDGHRHQCRPTRNRPKTKGVMFIENCGNRKKVDADDVTEENSSRFAATSAIFRWCGVARCFGEMLAVGRCFSFVTSRPVRRMKSEFHESRRIGQASGSARLLPKKVKFHNFLNADCPCVIYTFDVCYLDCIRG